MGYKRLYKNLIDIIKEEQAKLGFRKYPSVLSTKFVKPFF